MPRLRFDRERKTVIGFRPLHRRYLGPSEPRARPRRLWRIQLFLRIIQHSAVRGTDSKDSIVNKIVIAAIAVIFMGWLAVYGFKGQTGAADSAWKDAIAWSDAGMPADQIAATGKPVYIFISTEWCTFCKKMKGETFTDPAVQKILNDDFVNLHINPETQGETFVSGEKLSYKDLAQKLGVTGYPTSVFYSPEGELIGVQPGYIDARQMAQLANYIGGGHYKEQSFQDYLSASKS